MGLLQSAHYCSHGGISVTLAESCFDTRGLGATIDLDGVSADIALFSESASRIVVSVNPSDEGELLKRAAGAGVPASRIGRVGGSRLQISINGDRAIDIAVGEAEQVWATALEKYFKRVAA